MNPVLRFVGLLLTIPLAGFAGQTEPRIQEERQTTHHPAVQTLEPQLGENITLQCQAPSKARIQAVNWTKTDQESQNVLFYRDEQHDTEIQHASFVNRVQLQSDPKSGDLSLVLKNVTSSDYGTYECSIKEGEGENITPKSVCITILKEPGSSGSKISASGGVVGGVVGCVVGGVVVVCIFGYAIFKWRKKGTENNSHLPVTVTEVQQQLLGCFPPISDRD